MLFPSQPTLQSYKLLLNDYRIWVGFRTSFLLVVVGVPVSMLLTTMLAYGTSRGNYPGKKIIIGGILFTMLFNGGIIPLYLQMKEMGLTNTIWSVVLAGTVNVFYFVIMRNYFQSLPESLMESARLDGAGEYGRWISLPAMPDGNLWRSDGKGKTTSHFSGKQQAWCLL